MNFWDVHGIGFIIALCFFPRITLIFSSVITGGWLWWLGWLIAPRLLCATLATMHYADTNIILVVLTWMWALSFERAEKQKLRSRQKLQEWSDRSKKLNDPIGTQI